MTTSVTAVVMTAVSTSVATAVALFLLFLLLLSNSYFLFWACCLFSTLSKYSLGVRKMIMEGKSQEKVTLNQGPVYLQRARRGLATAKGKSEPTEVVRHAKRLN